MERQFELAALGLSVLLSSNQSGSSYCFLEGNSIPLSFDCFFSTFKLEGKVRDCPGKKQEVQVGVWFKVTNLGWLFMVSCIYGYWVLC